MSKLSVSLFLAALACFTLPALAQPPATPTAPPADPFVRDRNAKPASPSAAKTPEPPPTNILTTLETWSLSQADFVALLDGSADQRAPYDRLEALAKAGKATLVGLQAISTKPGQRAVVEAIDEVRYPTEFKPAERAHETAYPTAYETRNVGETLELEPSADADGKMIEVNLVPQSSHFDGSRDWKPEASAAPFGLPQFRTERVTTNMTVASGRPAFLATATPTDGSDEPAANPVHVRVLHVTSQAALPSPPVADIALNARAEVLIYSLTREAARRILNTATDSAQSHAAVRELLAKGEAQLEGVTAFVTKSGQRAVNEEVTEYSYPSHINPPSYPSPTTPAEGRAPPSLSRFETRKIGMMAELEATFDPEARIVDINVVAQLIHLRGMLEAGGAAAKYPPQPVFTTRKVTTSVSSGAGVPVLLGTISQPRDTGVNGRTDDGRTSLAYIRVTPVRP